MSFKEADNKFKYHVILAYLNMFFENYFPFYILQGEALEILHCQKIFNNLLQILKYMNGSFTWNDFKNLTAKEILAYYEKLYHFVDNDIRERNKSIKG